MWAFTYHFHERFDTLWSDEDEGLAVRYVVTDVTESNIGFWIDPARLRPFVAAGRLDLADPELIGRVDD